MARTDPNNRARYWADRRVRGLSLLHADFTRHDYASHRHEALMAAGLRAGLGLDRQACGGTHAASTGESPPIRILKIDNKGKRNRRIKIGLVEA